MPIHIEELAKIAKVSKTTVSLVINGRAREYRISKSTEKRVLHLAREHNFVPNPLARGMRLKKTQTLGLIVPYLNWHFSQIAQVLEKTARESGYQLLVTMTDDVLETEYALIQNLLARKVDGFIIATMMNHKQFHSNSILNQVPVVLIDRKLKGDNIGWVVSDDRKGTFEVVTHLCDQGVTDIHYLGGIKTISTSVDRLKGFKEALKVHGLLDDNSKIQETGYGISDGYEMARKLFKGNTKFPQAIFTSALTLLEGLLQYFKEHNPDALKKIQIASYDDHPMLDYVPGPIQSVRQNVGEIARKSFGIIHGVLEDGKPMDQILIPPQVIIR